MFLGANVFNGFRGNVYHEHGTNLNYPNQLFVTMLTLHIARMLAALYFTKPADLSYIKYVFRGNDFLLNISNKDVFVFFRFSALIFSVANAMGIGTTARDGIAGYQEKSDFALLPCNTFTSAKS